MELDLDDQGGFLTHTRSNNNMMILYVTLALVIILVFIWIVLVYATGQPTLHVLTALANAALQVPLADDTTVSAPSVISETPSPPI
jgi:hypothetical protein